MPTSSHEKKLALEIKAFATKDLDSFCTLLSHWGDFEAPPPHCILEQIQRTRTKMAGEVLLAFRKGSAHDELIAYAQMGEHTMVGLDTAMEVIALLVATEYRGQGIGSLLMKECEAWSKQQGYNSLMLSSQLFRTEAHKLYVALGFEPWKQSQFFRKAL